MTRLRGQPSVPPKTNKNNQQDHAGFYTFSTPNFKIANL